MPPLYRQFRDQEELDREYDVEKSVPDFMAYARHFVDESKLARHRLACELDVPYGPTLAEHLDIFPAGERNGPVLVFFHGGYWRMLSSKDFSLVAFGPVAAGMTVINVNYALCPAVTLDEIVRQARAAVAWTHVNAARHRGDPAQIFVAGHSAGAHLAAMCLATEWAAEYGLPEDAIKGALLVSGLYDLRPLPFTFVQPSLQLTADQALRNSPALDPPACAAPILVSAGGREPAEFQRQSRGFLAAWERRGNRGRFLPQPEADHFSALYGLAESEGALTRALVRMAAEGGKWTPRRAAALAV